MKNQALYSSKDKSRKLKCRLLQFLIGALRVKYFILSKVYTDEGGMKYLYHGLSTYMGDNPQSL